MIASKIKKKKDWKSIGFLVAILAVPISNFLIFWLYVNFESILMAFQYNDNGHTVWGLYNFALFWQDITSSMSVFWDALKNTMIFFLGNLCLTLPISLVLCYFFYKKIFGYKIFRFVFYLPTIIAASVYVVLFKYLTATNGLYGAIVETLGGTPTSLYVEGKALWTIFFYTIFTSFGGNIILLGGAMNQINPSILEAAKVDGCNMFVEFYKIIIPQIWPTLSTLVIFAFVGMFGASGPVLLFLNDKAAGVGANTLSFWIYSQVYFGGEYYYSATIGLILTAIGLPIALFVKKFLKTDEEVA